MKKPLGLNCQSQDREVLKLLLIVFLISELDKLIREIFGNFSTFSDGNTFIVVLGIACPVIGAMNYFIKI